MSRGKRITLFLISLAVLLIVYWVFGGHPLPKSETDIVVFSSLLMLSFTTLFLEHFFTSPTDVIAASIAILLVLSPLHDKLTKFGIWYYAFWTYCLVMLLAALLALLTLDASKTRASSQNTLSSFLKRFSTFFGNGRFLFTALFALTLVFYTDNQSALFIALALYAAMIVLVNPTKFLIDALSRPKKHQFDIGEIIGVQSKNTFLAKLYKERRAIKRFDVVEFRYSMAESTGVMKGLVLDTYLLNQEQWVKVLTTESLRRDLGKESANDIRESNVVYLVPSAEDIPFLKRFVGVVVEESTIGKMRFEYASRVEVSEGNLLEVTIAGKPVLYQIVEGVTEIERLEHRDEAAYIVGEAIQLGVWDEERRTFEKFGWVPAVNTPVFLAADIESPAAEPQEVCIGRIPNTNYPILLNKTEAVTHHLAVLGITGSGKSVFARQFIRDIVKDGIKVICVDFTNECGGKLADLKPCSLVASNDEKLMFKAVDAISYEMSQFKNNRDGERIEKAEGFLQSKFHEGIKSFLESDNSTALFELPDVSNTTGILDYTRWFFRTLFNIARKEKSYGKRVCIVLEEAHTIVPEWNFIGVSEKEAGALVNSIGQIALQGRKYNVGFVVIAQRTANVSKTILTQCNTIVAFQQFDKTGSEFLANYMGADMVSALPQLKFRQAIAVGKAFRTGIPLIFEVPEIHEKVPTESMPDGEAAQDAS